MFETLTTEPDIATQDDFEEIKASMKRRELIQPLRYHAVGIGAVVASSAFDRLRDAYLRETEVTFVGFCSLCKGLVNTGEQFLRTEVGRQFPDVSHTMCEERRQADQRTVLTALGIMKTNYKEREKLYATIQREDEGRNISEHPYRGDSGQAPKAGSSDSFVEGRQVSPEVLSIEQESTRSLNQHLEFRVDDVMSDGLISPSGDRYKWPPEFKRFYEGRERVSPQSMLCSSDPLGCNTDLDETNEQRYALEVDNGVDDPPLYDLAYNVRGMKPCCE